MISFDDIDKFTIEEILPLVSMDGGDIRLDRLDGQSVVFGAYAECALCPACNDDYVWWLSSRLQARFGVEFKVSIEKHTPYYSG